MERQEEIGLKAIIFEQKYEKLTQLIRSVGSCHHGMARPLGCGWGNRPPDMEVSCEYIE